MCNEAVHVKTEGKALTPAICGAGDLVVPMTFFRNWCVATGIERPAVAQCGQEELTTKMPPMRKAPPTQPLSACSMKNAVQQAS